MKKSIYLLVFAGFFAFTACNTVRVSSDYDRNASFTNYQSFAFHQNGLNDLKMNDLDKRRVVEAITNQMQAKGMTLSQSESSADLIINLTASHKNRVDVNQNMNPWWGYGWGWGWGWGPDYSVRQYKEGTLVIDLVDRAQNTLVWQGAGEGLNVSDLENKSEDIPKAVEEILAKYPPEMKSKG